MDAEWMRNRCGAVAGRSFGLRLQNFLGSLLLARQTKEFGQDSIRSNQIRRMRTSLTSLTRFVRIHFVVFFSFLSFSHRTQRVTCDQCGHLWCFLCHAPWHQQITCKQFQEGDRLLRNWAKQINQGQVNAQKCPTCKTFIQRSSGCDHMHCRNCQTDFCYQCGEKLRHLKFFGNHYSKLSVFGCKYRYDFFYFAFSFVFVSYVATTIDQHSRAILSIQCRYRAEQPVLRRTVRVSVFCAKLAAAPALCSAAVAAVGVAVAVGVVILPLYGLVRLGRWTMDKQQRKDVRAFAFHSSDSSQPKANDFIHPPNRFGLVCSGGNSNNGSARLLASARQLQRLTGNKTPAYPRLNRFVTLNSSGVSASGDSSESDARTGPNGLSSVYDIFSHKKESVEQVRTDSSAKQVDSSAFYSYIDLSDRPAIESRSTSTVDKSGTTGVFTMDYDSLDRIEQWSLNRTVFGMGQPSNLTRGEESLSTDQSIGSHSVGRQSKSRSGQSIKKNFILTSLF